jgi:transposase
VEDQHRQLLIRCPRSLKRIYWRLKVGPARITALKYGSALNHVRGRPASAILDQVSAFVETNLLANARISDQRMATIVNSEFKTHYDRTAICRMRNKLRFKWRPPFHIQRLSIVQIQQRIEFCRGMLAEMDEGERMARSGTSSSATKAASVLGQTAWGCG